MLPISSSLDKPPAQPAIKERLVLGRKLPWRVSDGVLAVALTLVIPIALALLVLVGARVGAWPQVWAQLLLGDDAAAQATQYLLALTIESVLIAWFVQQRQAALTDLGWRRFAGRWLTIAALLYVVQLILVIVAYSAVQALWPHVNLDQTQEVYPFGHESWAVGLSFVASVLVAPIVEETLFRGLFFASLTQRLPFIWSAVLSSLVFALLHGQLNVGIYTFLLGLMLCWLYRRSGSIFPGMVLHLLNNSVAFWALTRLH